MTYKIPMVSIASRVTLGEHERMVRAVPHIVELVNAPCGLEEHAHQFDWVRIGASANVIAVNRVDDVAPVVIRVKIGPIPAGGKVDGGAEAIRTVHIRYFGKPLWIFQIDVDLVKVKTGEVDGLLRPGIAGVSLKGIASDHAEPLREGINLVVLRTRLSPNATLVKPFAPSKLKRQWATHW